VSEAYSEGYKAASLRYGPDAEYYKTLSAELRAEFERETARRKKNEWKNCFLFGAGGFAAGILCAGLFALVAK